MLVVSQYPSSSSLSFLSSLSVAGPIRSSSTKLPITNLPLAPPFTLSNRTSRRGSGACRASAAAVEDATDKEEALLEPEACEGAGAKEEEDKYDWREEWYPLYLSDHVPEDAPLGLTVFHKQIVLYRDGQGIMRCYEDRCPHRLAKLSEGQITDGRLECLYHGWQFQGDGQCVNIPQVYHLLSLLVYMFRVRV
ncbi:protein TIC 55, chloroplastic [Iris pallida]|uniref:Protein TIC 55, chloroplastic n=1 Tax=Iris pallida TaxID=29817 RepID=A0AAX6HII2_IRIPA|nr:protein TIC 55, chloroplastic [Iris pallida]